ncbi:MAG TPA: magnesium-translocating P-type ATPase, partial [Armatimonadota bacterium]|nr:magnesium-translocating P-type ATPase [Armatimonadota bacterium]
DLVPGDIIHLAAGDLVPADARLLSVNDLHVRESALTGESLPVEKRVGNLEGESHALADAENSVFLGTSVQSGIATAIIIDTGQKSAFGEIAKQLEQRAPETEFDRGMRHFGIFITRIILLLVVFVFLVNILLKRPTFDSFLFAVALAVGLTPELLPMIITVTLAQGARRMAAKHVIVKQLESIENFGSMDILCCDKTGTLTEGEIILDRHVRIDGTEDDEVLQLIYVNSYFEAGIRSPIDTAILKHSHPDIKAFRKIDEIPFDFSRKRLSIVVEKEGADQLITKGEVESVFDICSQIEYPDQVVPMDKTQRDIAEKTYRDLSLQGYRVLAVAKRPITKQEEYARTDEKDMTLVGFAGFLDPPKPQVADTLAALKRDHLKIAIMTGDNAYVTKAIAQQVHLPVDHIITGTDVDKTDDDALAYLAENGAIFARVNPEQKNRVILALKRRGHVVGFLGDGINDAPSLHAADVGISVVDGVDVAKEAANIILLEKDLSVLHNGVLEGRRSFANIMKYIIMGTSSNFGNMFSMAGGSLILPFLPMMPTQILLNNLLYDISQISIPSDRVDQELYHRPKHWRIDFIREFMLVIGPISSLYDFITFAVLLLLFHANESLFHTGWFVESLATQTLVVFIIRTARNPFKSRPSMALTVTVLSIVLIAVILPFTPLASFLGLTVLPYSLLATIALLTLTYLALVQLVKRWFYRRHQLI